MEINEAKNKAKEFLLKNKLCVIATVSPDGKPSAATTLFMLDGEFDFYFITRRSTRKFKNLEKNKSIAVVFGVELVPFTVQGEGEAELLEGKLHEEFLGYFVKRPELQDLYFDFGPFLSLPGLDFAVFKVNMNWLRCLKIDPKTGKEEYCQLIG